MGRMLRSDLPDGRYHITTGGPGSARIFLSDLDRVEFLHGFDITMSRYGWKLLVYCLMDTHYHLVLDVKGKTVATAMKWLNGVYARRFNARHERRGHVFGGRYSTWFMRDEAHFLATVKYVLNNPVRAGLCERAQDWPWSYAADEVGGIEAADG